jgi:hypothetical protein
LKTLPAPAADTDTGSGTEHNPVGVELGQVQQIVEEREHRPARLAWSRRSSSGRF